MKKITVILLAVLMLFAFIACENDSGINRTVIEDSEGFKNAVAAGGFSTRPAASATPRMLA